MEPCILWTGAVSSSGYGSCWVNGVPMTAHRAAYEKAFGLVPAGLHIDHVRARGCTSRLCINPSHLEAVTQAENNRRSHDIGVTNRGKTHCPQGHLYDKENTRLYRGRRYCRTPHTRGSSVV